MRTRFTSVVAGLVTIAMVVFGQLCAFSAFVAHDESAANSPVATTAESDDHATSCDPSSCDGNGEEDGQSGCPSGAPSCCSTWGPPMDRLSVSPPSLGPSGLADAWFALDESRDDEKRVSEVALFELARPPGSTTEALLAASLSRRGPPAVT